MENRAIRTGNRATETEIVADLVRKAGIVIGTENGRGTVTTGDGVEVGHGIAVVAAGPAAGTGGVRGNVTVMTGETAELRTGRIVVVAGKVTILRARTTTKESSSPRA